MKKIVQSIVGNVEIAKDLNLLLIIGGLYSLSIALSNTFVNVYLWRQSGEFIDLAFYNLATVVLQPFTFMLAGRWAKKIDRVVVLRLGVIFLSIFYFTVLLLGNNASVYLILLGALLGTGYGFYWLSYNVLTFEITEPDTRDFFNGFLGILTSFAGMLGPISAGFLITYMDKQFGYKVIFSISLFLFMCAVALSFFLKRRSATGNFQLVHTFKLRKTYPQWKKILLAHFFQGLREGSFAFVIVVWIYIATESELKLGTYGLISSAVSFLSYYFVGRFLKPIHRKKAILIGGVLLYCAIFIIIFQLTYAKLIVYGIIISIAYPLLLVPYHSITYDVIGTMWKAAEMRVEYIVLRDVFANIGRISSILILVLFILLFGEEEGIPIALLLLGSGHFIIYFCIRTMKQPFLTSV